MPVPMVEIVEELEADLGARLLPLFLGTAVVYFNISNLILEKS